MEGEAQGICKILKFLMIYIFWLYALYINCDAILPLEVIGTWMLDHLNIIEIHVCRRKQTEFGVIDIWYMLDSFPNMPPQVLID